MSDTVLSGRWQIFYAAENNQKRIRRDTSVTPTTIDTVNALYSALQNLFDDPAQMDDVVPIKADTPDIYRLINQWFIDDESVEYLKGGSLFSDKWKDGTTEHVLVIGYAQTTEFNTIDIGRTIRGGTTGDTGTILDFNTGRKLVWIRPDDPAAAGDEFDNGTEAYTIGIAADGDEWGKVWQADDSGGPSFLDETTDANSAGANDWQFFPAGAGTNDYVAVGHALKFSKIRINVGTAGTGTYTVTWEYWNGATWAALTIGTDGTTGFKTAGSNNVTYTIPSDWATTSLSGSAQLYYIRARRDAGTVTLDPVGTEGWASGLGTGSFAAHGRQGSASKAGESAWAGITTIGSIEANSHLYIFQQDPEGVDATSETREKKVLATKGTSDWWGDGHLDILLKTKEADSIIGKLPASSPATGVATVLARQYSKTFSHFIATKLATAGGNTVVPLSTGDDLDNTTGSRRADWDGGSAATLVVDEILRVGSVDRAIVTAQTGGTAATGTVDYYLIGDPITDFVDNDAVTAVTSGKTFNVNLAPSDVGPALDTTVTVAFGATTQDINNGSGAKPYSIRINPASLAIKRVYERTKFITRRGSAVALQVQDGEEYVSLENQIEYNTQTTGENWVQGAIVFDITAKGRGRIIADTTDTVNTGDITLKEVRGTFTAANTIADAENTSITLDAALQEDDSGGPSFIDETADAVSAAAADVDPFPLTEAINDAFYLGAKEIFSKATITISTAGVGGVGLWEYWNGASWGSLEAVSAFVDSTTDLTAAPGAQTLVFSPPTDWVARTVGAGSVIKGPLFYIRLRVTTVYTTNPILTQVTLGARVTATIAAVGVKTITPIAAASFGTFAGGKFFGARGVTFTTANLAVGDEQAYQLIDNDGTTQIPPNVQTISVTNLVASDTVAVLRRTGASVLKSQFTTSGTNSQGASALVVNATIDASNPSSGKVRVVSPSNVEHRYRYSSFASATFTLATASTGTADAGSTTTNITRVGATFITDGVEVGDVVRNTTDNKVSTITAVNSETSLTVTSNGTTWSSKAYSLNTLMETYPVGQNVYVPFIERIATATSHSVTFTYSADINVKAVVRRSAATAILPFDQDTSVTSTGLSVAAIRTTDSIIT